MFVSGPWPVRVGRAGQEADGGEVGGGGGGVGLRGEAARRSGAASEVAVWACGVAAAARAAATAPGLRLFVLGALGGVAGVWEARESCVWIRFSAEPEGERMRTFFSRYFFCAFAPRLQGAVAGCGHDLTRCLFDVFIRHPRQRDTQR